MNIQEAEELSILLMQISGKLDQSVRFVLDKDTNSNFETYRLNVGKIMGELYLDMLRPLWDRYPELLPEDMGGPYKINPKIYEPSFYMPGEKT